MPRIARLALPGVPLHVVQRGNNRQPCFFQTADYQLYLESVFACAMRYKVAVHAYVLMTNHVHLLLTPAEKWGVSRMMQLLGATYVSKINSTYRRTGSLWEGRYKSSLIRTDRYLFACYRYIELNPVRAGMAHSPEKYRWSSYRTNAMGWGNGVITPHRIWTDLGADLQERCAAYKRLFSLGNTVAEDDRIRIANRKGRSLDG